MSKKSALILVSSFLLAIIVIFVPLLAGCNGDDEPVNGTPPPTNGTGNGDGNGNGEIPEIRIVYSTSGSASSATHVENERLYRIWDAVTPNHKIIYEPHYGDEIFPADQNIEAVASGALQMGGTWGYRAESFEPASQIFTLPVLWKSKDHLHRFVQSPEFRDVIERGEENGVMVPYFTSYFMWIASSDAPIHSLEDLDGIRIRTMASPIMVRAIELLGANPVSVVMAELTVAMQTGMFEGMIVALSPGYINMLGYLDYMNYVVEFPISYTLSAHAVNAEWYYGLPDDVRLAYEWIVPDWYHNRENISNWDREIGMEMWRTDAVPYILPREEEERWTAAIQPLFDEVDERLGMGLIDAALREQYGDAVGQYCGIVMNQPLEDFMGRYSLIDIAQ